MAIVIGEMQVETPDEPRQPPAASEPKGRPRQKIDPFELAALTRLQRERLERLWAD